MLHKVHAEDAEAEAEAAVLTEAPTKQEELPEEDIEGYLALEHEREANQNTEMDFHCLA
jgi:hypothetical protein